MMLDELPRRTHSGKHFVVRKIRNGRVKIGGRWFAPRPETPSSLQPTFMPWTDLHRLDGQWWAFGRYWAGSELYVSPQTGRTFVEMWGPAEKFYYDGEDYETHAFDEANVDEHGFIHWMTWDEIA